MTSNTQGDSIDSALPGWVNEALLMGDAGLCRPEELPSCKHIMTLSGFLEFPLYESKVSPAFEVFSWTKEPERMPGSLCMLFWGL